MSDNPWRTTVAVVTKATSKVLEDALKLEARERAELASELIASLEPADDEDVEAAWEAEIQARVALARSGEDPGRPWEDVLEDAQRGLRRR